MNIGKLAKSDVPAVKKIFSIIAGGKKQQIAGDAVTPIYMLSEGQRRDLIDATQEQIEANYIEAGIETQSLEEARKNIICGDMAINPVSRIGTLMDPSIYTHSSVPIMMGPGEVTSLYASGGLPAEIIDKKSRAMLANGISFRTRSDRIWNNDKIEQLEEAADATGLNDNCADSICYTFIYGGGLLYPVFKGESPTSLVTDRSKLNLEKGCIDRWVVVDRWNTTFVPSFLITERDYLTPDTIYVAQTGLEINTSRCAIMRPKPMPFWAIVYNMGWSPSDFSGWMTAYYGYEVMMQALPIMAQQMSLILYKMPMDALNATIGPEQVEKLMAINEQKMAEWSALKPSAVNMIGDVEVVDRTYSGFEQFVGAAKSNLAAQCGLPEPSLWHTPNKGFADNTQESLLKSSETLQMHQKHIERSMNNIRDILIAHTFGADSEEYKNKDLLKITFNKPIISTEKDMAEVGARFAAAVSSFTQSGVSPDVGILLSKPFFPAVRVTDDMISEAKSSYDKQQQMALEIGKQKQAAFGGQSNSGPKTQTPGVGHFSKAK